MTKKLSAIITMFILAVSISVPAGAATIKCTVEAIEDGKVMLNCGEDYQKLKTGDEVKVKTKVKLQAIEGC